MHRSGSWGLRVSVSVCVRESKMGGGEKKERRREEREQMWWAAA